VSRLTDRGREAMVAGLARALAGGTMRSYDGDGRLVCESTFPRDFECDAEGFVFKGLAGGRAQREGTVVFFGCCPAGSDESLLTGSFGPALGKGVDVELGDRHLYAGMILGVTEFRHVFEFDN
jgi:hypothetical protein